MKGKRIFSAMLICLAVLLCACTSIPSMSPDGGAYRDDATGVKYLFANQNYLMLASRGDVVGKIERSTAGDLLLYAVKGLPADRFLTTENGELVYSSAVQLPTLWDMAPNEIKLYRVQASSLSFAAVKEQETVDAVVKAYREGHFFKRSEILAGMDAESFELRFAATGNYTGLGYSLYYLHYEKDVCIYDTVTDRDAYQSIYPGMSYTLEEFDYTDSNGNAATELLAVYNFGTELLYDRATGMCCSAGDLLVEHVD